MRSDLTAAARIRDAAIGVFGRRGFVAASIRQIAQEAGVSPALVMHHYGSKENLRASCDEYLIGEGLKIGVDLDDDSQVSAVIASFPANHPWLVYIARIILDGGAAGDTLWDRLADEATRAVEGGQYGIALREGIDAEAASAVATAVGLIPLVFQTHLARSMGCEELDGEAYERVMTTLMDLMMNGIYEDQTKGNLP